jgi:hypothetical protein
MFRTALLRSARSAAAQTVRRSGAIARPIAAVATPKFAPVAAFQAVRCYSAAAGLSKSEVEGRIVDLLKNFDKVCLEALRIRAKTNVLYRSPTHQRYDIETEYTWRGLFINAK